MGRHAFTKLELGFELPALPRSATAFGNSIVIGTMAVNGSEKYVKAASLVLGKKPISQLEVAYTEEGLRLFSLSDTLRVLSLPELEIVHTVPAARGAECFAISDTPGATVDSATPVLVAFAVKRKLHIAEWKSSRLSEPRVHALPHSPKCAVWCGQSVCVGFLKEYVMVHAVTGAVSELFSTGKLERPIVARLWAKEVLLNRGNVSIFVGYDGTPTRQFGLSWSEEPTGVVSVFPYAVGSVKNFVEIRALETQALVQALPVAGVRHMSINKEAGMDQNIHTAVVMLTDKSVYCLATVPLLEQVDMLVSDGEFEEALTLCGMIRGITKEERVRKLSDINLQYAVHLMGHGRFEDAERRFRSVRVRVAEVLRAVPELLPGSLSGPASTRQRSGSGQRTGSLNASSSAGARTRTTGIDDGEEGLSLAPLSLQHARRREALAALGRVFEGFRDRALEDEHMLIDTALFKIYLEIDEVKLRLLLGDVNNAIVFEDAERALLKEDRQRDLVYLYKSRGEHDKALVLLHRLFLRKPSDSDTAGVLVEYLRDMPGSSWSLIQQYTRPVLKANPEEGVRVFLERGSSSSSTAGTSATDDELPADKVAQLVREAAPAYAIAVLEHLVTKCGTKDPSVHNGLIEEYLKQIYKERSQGGADASSGSTPTQRKLMALLENSHSYEPEKVLAKVPSNMLFDERALLLKRLGRHYQALLMYMERVKDLNAARAYCEKYGDGPDAGEMYLALFRMYVADKFGPPSVQDALALWHDHASVIDPVKALSLLPNSLPIAEASNTLEEVLTRRAEAANILRTDRNLRKYERIRAEQAQLDAMNRRVVVDASTVCADCRRPLATSAFARTPVGELMHLSCYRRILNG